MRSPSLPSIVAVAGAVVLLSTLTYAQTPSSSTTPVAHTYKVKLGHKDAGWERVQITQQDKRINANSTSELNLNGLQYSISTSADIENGEPSHYTIDVKQGHDQSKYTVDFKYGQAVAKIEKGHKTGQRVAPVGGDVTLLDNNVWYQYQFLIAKYDLSKGGIQQFSILTPYPALRHYPALVEFQKETKYKLNGEKVDARLFGIELGGGFQLLVTVGEDGVPLEIEIPARDEKITLESQ